MPDTCLRSRGTYALAGLVIACFAGCSHGHELETAKVRGTVTLDGRLLESGGVMFIPPRGRAATGIVQPDGTYVIGTYSATDGAVVGPHNVTINPNFPNAGGEEEERPITRGNIYTVPRPFVGIPVVVESGQENVIDIPLRSMP